VEAFLDTPVARALDRRLAASDEPVHPDREDIFRALELTPPDAVKVVILGQDPYHGRGQANGLAFSVRRGVRLPPSLANVYRELEADLGIPPAAHGELDAWARRGFLLLNTVLTVPEGTPGGHAGWGWEALTGEVLRAVASRPGPVVFLLWGRQAQARTALTAGPYNHRIACAHPSPLSAFRGFLGSSCFSRANDALRARGAEPVDWRLPALADARVSAGAVPR
jgi:uracil-DNA glycosylase